MVYFYISLVLELLVFDLKIINLALATDSLFFLGITIHFGMYFMFKYTKKIRKDVYKYVFFFFFLGIISVQVYFIFSYYLEQLKKFGNRL